MIWIIPLIKNLKNNDKVKIDVIISNKFNAKNWFLVLFLFFISLTISYAQTIRGAVEDLDGNPLNAKLLIKKESNPNIISEFCMVLNGKYTYKLKKTYTENISIEVVSTGYSSEIKNLAIKNTDDFVELNFRLFKEKTTTLDEIHIVAKKAPFTIKKDTIVFNINAYKDGSERKIEDILKKLPGIEINELTGSIRYKGKSIETVMLEGDDLFGHNYTLGTKNINADMVKEVEAIENYSENALLKGIEYSEKVALNLKLKENKTDISGNIDFGIGDFSTQNKMPLDLSSNLLGINKVYKSFMTLSYNNIGESYSPISYSNNELNFEAIKEIQYYAKKIIPETGVIKIADQNLSNINQQFFGSYNSIFNFGKKISTKVNLYYLNDRINSNQNSVNNYTFNNESFSTFDNFQIVKKPLYYRGDILFKYKISDVALLEYTFNLRDEAITTEKDIISNQNNDFRSNLYSKDLFLKQRLLYTKKLSANKALQLSAHYSTNAIDQNFIINPSIFNSEISDFDRQNIISKKHYIDTKSELLASRENDKYNFIFGMSSSTEPFNSELFSVNDTLDNSLENPINQLKFNQYSIYNSGSYHWNIGNFRISPNYQLRFLSLNLKGSIYNASENNNHIIFEPSVNLNYRLNSTSGLYAAINFNKNSNTSNYLFTNAILINNRTVLKNNSNLNLFATENYELSYRLYDLFNQTQLNIGASYQKEKGGFFSDYLISSNNTYINNFFLPENTDRLSFNFEYSKLISSLATNVKLNSNYSIYNYKNIVNASELRYNQSKTILHKLLLKTAFDTKINFQNEISYNQFKTYSTETFNIKSIQNNFKIILKPLSDFYTTLSFDYFIPDLIQASQNYLFIDSKISYKPKNKNWEIGISGTNLANEKSFEIIQNTDFSTHISKISLLNRFVLLHFNYNF